MRFSAAAALGVAALLLTGCSQGPDSGALSVAWVRERAKATGSSGASTCPVKYDIVAAAKASGQGGQAGTSPGGPAATADVDDPTADPDSPIRRSEGAVLDCVYRIDAQKLHVYTVGVGKGAALALLAPRVQSDAEMSTAQMKTWLNKAATAERGQPVATPGQSVVSVRLPMDGPGDLALIVSLGQNAKADPQLEHLAKELAGQART
ncbi:hypothetical protein [Streptomyces violascens]|uniref:hypothetical protein n=1 Tax=Streptomyces violascens TaxID=67381 RepID=UPI00167495B9|nr:hypothetical protein [Streptomyces violascens]